jgi:hypothetical protein
LITSTRRRIDRRAEIVVGGHFPIAQPAFGLRGQGDRSCAIAHAALDEAIREVAAIPGDVIVRTVLSNLFGQQLPVTSQ